MSSASLISPASSPTLRPPGPRHNDVQDPPKSRTAAAPSSCTSGPPERTRRNKRPFSVNGPSGAFCYSNRRRPEIPERRFKRTAGSGSHQPHVASPETCCRQPVWRVREDSQSQPTLSRDSASKETESAGVSSQDSSCMAPVMMEDKFPLSPSTAPLLAPPAPQTGARPSDTRAQSTWPVLQWPRL